MSNDVAVPPRGRAGHKTWREAVDREVVNLGWSDHTRIEQPHEGITVCVFEAGVEKDTTFHPEGPETFSLSIFLNGRGTVSVTGAVPLTVTPGTAIIFSSKSYCSGENFLPGGQRICTIDFRFEKPLLMQVGGAALVHFGGDLLTAHSLPEEGVCLVGFPAPAALLLAAREIASCSLEDGIARRLLLYSKAIESLSIAIATLEQHPQLAGPAPRPDERRRVEEARRLIETKFDQDWTIARLSRAVGLNERKLKHGFRLLVGNSIHAHLRHIRLDAAAILLRDGHSVTETALSVGFESLSHFSRVFSEAKGISPSRFARQSSN